MSHRRLSTAWNVTPAVRIELTLLATAATLIAVYVLLRHAGRWGENDTATFARAVRSVVETGHLAGGPGYGVYNNGYGYPALVTFLMGLSGLSLAQVQIFVAPLLVAWPVVPAWLAYRELTGSGRVATLATAILLTQPELLFVILRGTHEKFTRGLMLLCLYLLLRSLGTRTSPGRYAAFVIGFYLVGYTLITSNNLMATSYVAAFAVALAFIWGLGKLRPRLRAEPATLRRMALMTVSLAILSFLFLFYIYPPALSGFLLLENMLDKVSTLLLGGGSASEIPYGTVTSQWVNTEVYLVLSLANWLLLIGSVILWCGLSWRWVVAGGRPQDERELLLWAFFGAFAVQGALSILVDLSGALSVNLQHRVFPSFALLAAPLAARSLARWQPKGRRSRQLSRIGVYSGAGLIALLSTLKATNDPLLSNKWYFYAPAEMQAVDWATQALPYRGIWLEQDERLFSAARLLRSGAQLGFAEDDADADPGTPNFVVSDITVSRSQRMGLPLPVRADDLITYDNGAARMYHRRPTTPYQP